MIALPVAGGSLVNAWDVVLGREWPGILAVQSEDDTLVAHDEACVSGVVLRVGGALDLGEQVIDGALELVGVEPAECAQALIAQVEAFSKSHRRAAYIRRSSTLCEHGICLRAWHS